MTFKSWYYDHFVADKYDTELEELTNSFRQTCIEQMQISAGDSVLDLGCGTGLNQPLLAERIGSAGRIVGVDASKEMLARAQARADTHGYADRLELVQGDIRKLDTLVTGPMDAVLATLILSVVPAWREVFSESFNLLKPGGHYGIVDNYWEKPGFQLWLASWRFAANAKRCGYEPLQQVANDFVLGFYPPDSEVQFYVATGTKPGP